MASSTAKSGTLPPPQQCNSFWVNHLSMLLVYGFLVYSYIVDPSLVIDNVLWIPVMFALPITIYELLELKVYKRASVGLGDKPNLLSLSRVAVKFYGFCMTLLTIAAIYWLLPEYRGAHYQIFFDLAYKALPYLMPLGLLYFIWMDTRLKEPRDDYWHAGMFFLGCWKEVNFSAVKSYSRSWLVKAFFLPLMTQFLYSDLHVFVNTRIVDWSASWSDIFTQLSNAPFYVVYDQIIRLIFIADLIPACLGYALTIRFMDNHIRSADDSMKGWFFCLACYPPFWGDLFFPHYMPYMDGYNWSNWLGESPWRWVWAGTIIASLVIYSSASVCFGTRWSNLTYRGLMCKGPYRITKHPAYLFKNFSWWMIGIPFIVEGTLADSIKQCLFSLGVNYLYYQRAITEEKHLSRYPEYRAYALWMNEHGMFSFLNRWIPLLKYDPARYGYPEPENPDASPDNGKKTKYKKKKAT